MMARRPSQPQEELVENQPTGLEVETDQGSADGAISEPYDPTLIRVDPKMYSLRNILDMIDEEELDLAPDFQRLKVWKPWQKSRLIESILLRIPLPAFYFSSAESGTLQVVDGVQRLTTIYDFVRGGADGKSAFRLTDLEYLEDEVGGKTFKELEGTSWAKRLHSTQIVANVIDPQTPAAVKFDIFKRINTGGAPLTAQEIRHCISGATSRELLKRLASSKEFDIATGGRIRGHLRMADREMVLRVLAFRLATPDYAGPQEFDSLEQLLNWATLYIDTNLLDSDRRRIEGQFLDSMKLCHSLFGIHAFRKWPPGATSLYPINKALFEVWGVHLSNFTAVEVMPVKEKIVKSFRALFSEDNFFVSCISSGTGDPKKIRYRFLKVREVISKCLEQAQR